MWNLPCVSGPLFGLAAQEDRNWIRICIFRLPFMCCHQWGSHQRTCRPPFAKEFQPFHRLWYWCLLKMLENAVDGSHISNSSRLARTPNMLMRSHQPATGPPNYTLKCFPISTEGTQWKYRSFLPEGIWLGVVLHWREVITKDASFTGYTVFLVSQLYWE